ncbi:MAG: hypothetical protein ACLRWP_00225 [Bilophila wadsworthia]
MMRLAGAGHRDVFSMGERVRRSAGGRGAAPDERMKDAALALRVALHTDGRQFKAFLEA